MCVCVCVHVWYTSNKQETKMNYFSVRMHAAKQFVNVHVSYIMR